MDLLDLVINNWISTIVIALTTGFLGLLNLFRPRVLLAIKNCFKDVPPRSKEGFHFALCWLKDDATGHKTEFLEQAVAAYIELLEVLTSDSTTDQWEQVQKNRNTALQILRERRGRP